MRHRVAVDVVPPGVEDVAGVRDRGEPLVGVVEGERAQVAAVGLHAVQRVDVPPAAELAAEAPGVAPPPRRAEGDAPVGKPGGHQVVVGPAGNLLQLRAVDVDRVDVVEALVLVVEDLAVVEVLSLHLDVGEHDLPAVEREPRLQHAAAVELALENVAAGQRPAGLVQHEDPAAGPRTPAVILHHQVAVRGGHPLAEEQAAEVHQRVGQRDAALQPADPLVEPAGCFRRQVLRPGRLGQALELDRLLGEECGAVGALQVAQQLGRLLQVPGDGGRVGLRRLVQLVLRAPRGLDHQPEVQLGGLRRRVVFARRPQIGIEPAAGLLQCGGHAAAKIVEPAGGLLRAHRLL